MVSKSQIKLIKSLSQKKYRYQHKLFVVEGEKGVRELLDSDFELFAIFASENKYGVSSEKFYQSSNIDLKKISFLKTAPDVLAVFKIADKKCAESSGLKVVLDGVRDPGNLGTIIRLCDWFGVQELICSQDTVDCYNPKVVQATMGSLSRVRVRYADILEMLRESNEFIYGTLLEGENIYTGELEDSGYLILGNEANGISEDIQKTITRKITIPQFGSNQKTESLNVATATAIALSEFKRKGFIEK